MHHCARLTPSCTSKDRLWESTRLLRSQRTHFLWSAGSTERSSSSSAWRRRHRSAVYVSWWVHIRTTRQPNCTRLAQTLKWVSGLLAKNELEEKFSKWGIVCLYSEPIRGHNGPTAEEESRSRACHQGPGVILCRNSGNVNILYQADKTKYALTQFAC